MRTMFVILIISCFVFCSCDEKELQEYEGPSEVYFFQTNVNRPDTSEYSFVEFPERDVDTMRIHVQLLGRVVSRDRYFKIVVDESNSTAQVGKHYEALPETFCLPAGEDATDIGIIIRKQADLDLHAVYLVLKMEATSDFVVTMPVVDYESFLSWEQVKGGMHTLMFSNRYKKPASYIWDEYYFDKFSQKKLALMLEQLNVSYKEFVDPAYMTYGRMTFIAEFMYDYIKAEAEKGNILKDEDGEVMVFNPY